MERINILFYLRIIFFIFLIWIKMSFYEGWFFGRGYLICLIEFVFWEEIVIIFYLEVDYIFYCNIIDYLIS